jgi:hypothetical protein
LAAARRIPALEDALAAERAVTARLHARLAAQDPPGSCPGPGPGRYCPARRPPRGSRARAAASAARSPVSPLSRATSACSRPVSSCSCSTRRMPARFSPSAVSAQISASRSMPPREYRRVPPALRAGSSSPSRS